MFRKKPKILKSRSSGDVDITAINGVLYRWCFPFWRRFEFRFDTSAEVLKLHVSSEWTRFLPLVMLNRGSSLGDIWYISKLVLAEQLRFDTSAKVLALKRFTRLKHLKTENSELFSRCRWAQKFRISAALVTRSLKSPDFNVDQQQKQPCGSRLASNYQISSSISILTI